MKISLLHNNYENMHKNTSFKGVSQFAKNSVKNLKTKRALRYDKFTNKLAELIASFSQTKFSDGMVKGLEKFKGPSVVLSHMASIAVTSSYMQNTAKSKDIPKERKPSLLINMAGLTIVSSFVTTILDHFTGRLVKELSKAHREIKPGLGEAAYRTFDKTADKMKSLSIFTFVVRFAVPVLMVPVTGAIVKAFNENKEKKAQEALEMNKKDKQADSNKTTTIAKDNATNDTLRLKNILQIDSLNKHDNPFSSFAIS